MFDQQRPELFDRGKQFIAHLLLEHFARQPAERRTRPDEMVYQPWLDRQWAKITAALDMLNADPPKLPKKITVGQIALRACLGYLSA